MLVIDAANVIGSRPNGWWRDRPGAASRFTERVRRRVHDGTLDLPVTIVLEGRARAGVAEDAGDVAVVHAVASGDDTIAAIVADRPEATVVTADRELAERVRRLGADVRGPSWLLGRLGD